jgi:hypothetical protein
MKRCSCGKLFNGRYQGREYYDCPACSPRRSKYRGDASPTKVGDRNRVERLARLRALENRAAPTKEPTT